MDRPTVREAADGLPPEQVQWAAADWQPRRIAEFSASVIEPEVLLADTGSCLIACPTAQDRLLCYLPPACVVIARACQLAEHLPAAWAAIAATGGRSGPARRVCHRHRPQPHGRHREDSDPRRPRPETAGGNARGRMTGMSSRVGADGRIDVAGNTRTGRGQEQWMGHEKGVNLSEITLCLLYHYVRTGNKESLAAA